jgi:hypothetical protein
MQPKPIVLQLSDAQLIAYNNRDIDAFCACYHEDVLVLDEAGKPLHQGMASFREGYGKLFAAYETKAWITERVCLSRHVVEKERWQRRHTETGEETSGEVIVRYTVQDDKIAIVSFLRE